jgi:hypothetical protein
MTAKKEKSKEREELLREFDSRREDAEAKRERDMAIESDKAYQRQKEQAELFFAHTKNMAVGREGKSNQVPKRKII